MNYRLLLLLAIPGLLIALSRIFWISSSDESLYWIGLFIATPFAIARYCREKFFYHGFILGIAYSLLVLAFQLYFYDDFIILHAQDATVVKETEEFSEPFMADSPKVNLLIMIPLFGILKGLLLGFCSHIASFIIPNNDEIPETQA